VRLLRGCDFNLVPIVGLHPGSLAIWQNTSICPNFVMNAISKSNSVLAPLLKIGELAKQTQVAVATLRHYEGLGLLESVRRSPSGYRFYASESVQQVQFIKKAQTLGFTLAEIQKLQGVRIVGKPVPTVVKKLLEQKILILNQEISRLQTFQTQLEEYRDRFQAETSIATYSEGLCRLIEGVSLPVLSQVN
jgi:DNA-binding transcriptional MerR regulator